MALDTDGHQWKQLAIATSFRSAGPKVGSRCQVGTYHLQTTVQVRPARPQTSTAPSTRETTDARGSFPESGTRTELVGEPAHPGLGPACPPDPAPARVRQPWEPGKLCPAGRPLPAGLCCSWS